VERAQCSDWADRQLVYNRFCAAVPQQGTYFGVVWQVTWATEIMDLKSPLHSRIAAALAPHYKLAPVLIHPPMKGFTLPSEIDGVVEKSKSIYGVIDIQKGTEDRSTDFAFPMLDERTDQERAILKAEAKYGYPFVGNPSSQNLKLRKQGVEFFEKAETLNKTAKSKTLNMYIASVKLKLDLKWGAELKEFLRKPGNGLLDGPEMVDGCRAPLHLFFKRRWDSTDFGKWQAGVREELLSSYLADGVGVQ
jgi:hypothetical protein